MHKRILLINPNTSQVVTDILATHARRMAGGAAEVHAVTAHFGSPALEVPADIEIAGRAVLDVIAANATFDAAIIGAFGDPGLDAARSLASMPVFGLGRSGLLDAGRGGRRFAIVTLGETLRPQIEQSVERLGLAGQAVALRFLAAGVLDVARDRAAFLDAAVRMAAACADESGADAILFGGAPFAGIGPEIAHRLAVPVVDGLTSAMACAMDALSSG